MVFRGGNRERGGAFNYHGGGKYGRCLCACHPHNLSDEPYDRGLPESADSHPRWWRHPDD